MSDRLLDELDREERAALVALLRTPPGGWPETEQAHRRLLAALPVDAGGDDRVTVLVSRAVRAGWDTHPDRRAKRGRPPVEHEPRSGKLVVRCTPSARERWRAAADMSGEELSERVRDHLDAWAERVLTAE